MTSRRHVTAAAAAAAEPFASVRSSRRGTAEAVRSGPEVGARRLTRNSRRNDGVTIDFTARTYSAVDSPSHINRQAADFGGEAIATAVTTVGRVLATDLLSYKSWPIGYSTVIKRRRRTSIMLFTKSVKRRVVYSVRRVAQASPVCRQLGQRVI